MCVAFILGGVGGDGIAKLIYGPCLVYGLVILRGLKVNAFYSDGAGW